MGFHSSQKRIPFFAKTQRILAKIALRFSVVCKMLFYQSEMMAALGPILLSEYRVAIC